MQSNYRLIYKELADEKGKPEQLYKDVGNFIFQETYDILRHPTSLITKLKGIGSWHLRKKRMDIIVSEWVEKTFDEFSSQYSIDEYNQKKAQYELFKERLKDYEEYLAIKREIRKKRNESQVLLEPNKRED